jgi:signal peptidase I
MTDAKHATERTSTTRRSGSHGTVRFLRDILIIFLAAILISFLIKTFLVQSFYIPSGSMMNTLQINDRILVDRLVPNVTPLKRGDVIVFTDPGGWLAGEQPAASSAPTNPVAHAFGAALTAIGLGTQDSDNHLIKRVIGLPGDKVSCCNAFGQLEVNGVPIKEPYITVPAGGPDDAFTYSVTVPKGHLWVLGDNRDQSADSAYHYTRNDVPQSFVPISDVEGRAFVITWPIPHWSTLSNYPDVFRGTDPK